LGINNENDKSTVTNLKEVFIITRRKARTTLVV